MSEEATFTDDDIAEGAAHPALGPAYFAARRVVEGAMAAFQDEHIEQHVKPIIKKTSDELYEHLMRTTQDYLWSNAEMNLQGEMWRMVDQIVKALLSGEGWAVKKYVLGERYDCDKVRATVAQHVPVELQDARIADLEAEVTRLTDEIAWLRR